MQRASFNVFRGMPPRRALIEERMGVPRVHYWQRLVT